MRVIKGEQFAQSCYCYAVARVQFEPAILQLHGKKPTTIPRIFCRIVETLAKSEAIRTAAKKRKYIYRPAKTF